LTSKRFITAWEVAGRGAGTGEVIPSWVGVMVERRVHQYYERPPPRATRPGARPPRLHFPHDAHINEAGHRFVADTLIRWIAAHEAFATPHGVPAAGAGVSDQAAVTTPAGR
jgi:hypothetical protein